MSTRLSSRWFCLPLAMLGMFLVGCQGKPEMAQVRGKVTYKNGAVPRGGMCVVKFQPTGVSTAKVRKGASGDIKPDGTFEAWTRKPGDGVYLGEYSLSFAVWASATDPSSSLIPEKCSNPNATGLTLKVDGDIEDLKYEIEPLPGAKTAAISTGPAGSAAK